jgi:hypothetical protein
MGNGLAAFDNRAGFFTGGGTAPMDNVAYDRLYPYYAEICALSELKKKPGFGIPLNSGIGGHCLLYLNGVQRDRSAGYPMLKLCAPDAAPAAHGVAISVNSHYKNANWVAAEGRDFIWRGMLEPGERLTRESYDRTQDHAKAIGILDGVEFQDHLFGEKPPSMTARDYMYEISIATDYAARFGRDIYRARVPLDPVRMTAVIDYLNTLNTPYREGKRIFKWSVFTNNCAHVVHNALAEAGVWPHRPTGDFIVRAAFTFPVPKNEFVDLMLRANDLPIQDAKAIYKDKAARHALLEKGTLPAMPGSLAAAERAVQQNDIYDVDRLRLIFFDNPFWGPYRFRFARIFTEKKYSDLATNMRHFAALYESAQMQSEAGFSGDRADFHKRYNEYIAQAAAQLRRQMASLGPSTERLPVTAS